jgi:hypothetical protein
MNRFGKRIVIIVSLAALVAGCAADGSDDDPSTSSEAAPDDATAEGSTPDDDPSESDTSGATDEDDETAEDAAEGDDPAQGGDEADDAPRDGEGPPSLATESSPVATDTLEPVPAFEEAPFGDGLIATVTDIEEVELEGMGPGETSGPGILVSLELHNDSSEDIDLTGLVVNASYDGGTPAIANTSPVTSPLSDLLAPGDRRDGVYAFRVPPKQAGSVRVEIQHNASANIVVIQL